MDEYNKIKKFMSLFDKEDYFNIYSNADLFVNLFSKKKYMYCFLSDFLEDSVGVQLFNNEAGFDYVHDVLTLDTDSMLLAGRMDSICAIYLSRDLLSDEDKDYIHKMGYRVKKEKNLIIYRYEKGHAKRYANKKEMKDLIENCEFVYSYVKENFTDTMSAFEANKHPVSFIDEERLEYHTAYLDLPNLSVMPRKMPVNKNVVEDFKSIPFTGEECYMFVAYTPLIIKETGVRPLIVYFYFADRNKVVFKYITDAPKEYKNYIYGILDDVFREEGIPEKLYLNDRHFYSYLFKTLAELHIEVELALEDNEVDLNLLDAVEKLYQHSENLYTESKDGIEMVLETIVSELNTISKIIEEEEEPEEKEKIVV